MWKKLNYSKSQIVKAGKVIRNKLEYSKDEYENAIMIVDNWRASHAYPLHIIYKNYRTKVGKKNGYIVAERLKRLTSIINKLQRINTMNLWEMQDIGGCRVIVPTIKDVYKTIDLYKKSDIKHKFVKDYDYIKIPKNDGYRSYHMVYKYYSDKNNDYNSNFQIEIQVRTRIQHLWSTAVETYGLITKQNLKSDFGNEDELRFFKLVSTLFAMEENTNLPDSVSTNKDEILKELKDINNRNNIINKLRGYKVALDAVSRDSKDYYLLSLDLQSRKLKIIGYDKKQFDLAISKYHELEDKENPLKDTVLVSSKSFNELKTAYPNYFADISEFVSKVENYLK